MKCCIKCYIEKDDGEFVKDRNVCKICYREQQKQYRQNNTEAIKELHKQYYQNNKEGLREFHKQYYQNNSEALKEQQKQYYQNNKEGLREQQKQYRQNNNEAIKERQKQWYQNNKEGLREKQKQHRKNNPEKEMLTGARSRAKQKNLPFNISEEDINIPNVCPVLGIPLEPGIGKGITQPNSPTLDRIIPEKGYIKGNVIVISHKANTMKNNATLEQMIMLGEFAKKLLEEQKNENNTTN